jgi:FG-GAP-like repeat
MSIATLTIADKYSTTVSFKVPWYQQWTNGTTSNMSIAGLSMPGIRAVGDFNNDNLDDLVVHFGDVLIQPIVLLSNGDGTFRQSKAIPLDAERRHIRNGDAQDINGDGNLDFIGYTSPHGTKETLLGPTWNWFEPPLIMLGDGKGGFSTVAGLKSGSFHGGATGDINSDGIIDVFALPSGKYSPSGMNLTQAPLLQTVSSGNSNFSASTNSFPSWLSELQTDDMRMADFNGDGKIDFAVLIGGAWSDATGRRLNPSEARKLGAVAIAYGDGTTNLSELKWSTYGGHSMSDANWQAAIKQYGNGSEVGSAAFPATIDSFDLDGDGDLDIIISDSIDFPSRSWFTSGIQVLKNTASGFIEASAEFFPKQVTNQNVSSPTNFADAFFFADVNFDGLKDVILSLSNSDSRKPDEASASIFLNRGGYFLPINQSESLSYKISNVGDSQSIGDLITGDFNGDGVTDLVSLTSIRKGSNSAENEWAVLLHQGNYLTSFNNEFRGTASNDTLSSNNGLNIFRGLAGNDLISGTLDFVDSAAYFGARSDFNIKIVNGLPSVVADRFGNEGTDSLTGIERLLFSNLSVAFDINGSAGTTAKLLGAVFGKDSLTNKQYVGIGLSLLDAGMSTSTLASLAVDAANLKTNDQIVSTLWKNVFGTTASNSDKAPYIKLLDDGMTPGTLAWLAADTTFNKVNINLVGLAQTGIEYIPVS